MVWKKEYADNRRKKRRAEAKTGGSYKAAWRKATPAQKKKNYSRKKAGRMKTCPKGQEVDHKDRNANNNKKSNLRCLPAKENRGWSKGKKLGKRKKK